MRRGAYQSIAELLKAKAAVYIVIIILRTVLRDGCMIPRMADTVNAFGPETPVLSVFLRDRCR